MMRMDFNCFAGGWPFHKVRRGEFEDICARHKSCGIEGGYISSSDAIFYNDPYEADRDLARKVCGNYRYVMTVNPTLPGLADNIRSGVGEFGAAGVRIFPGFHGYSLTDPVMKELYELLEELKLPLFISLRMEDDRSTYLFHPRVIPIYELRAFLSSDIKVPTVLCNVLTHELQALTADFKDCENAFADLSGMKDFLFVIEQMVDRGLANKLIYGTNAPLFCIQSSFLALETAEISMEIKENIFSGRSFLNQVKKL